MKRILVIVICIFSFGLSAQEWKDELSRDIVELKEGKMTFTELTLITHIREGTTLQVKTYAEAPANDFISRDQFVAWVSLMSYIWVESFITEPGLTADDFKFKTISVQDMIGKPDLKLSLYMSAAGVQFIVFADGNEERFTQTWESIFE